MQPTTAKLVGLCAPVRHDWCVVQTLVVQTLDPVQVLTGIRDLRRPTDLITHGREGRVRGVGRRGERRARSRSRRIAAPRCSAARPPASRSRGLTRDGVRPGDAAAGHSRAPAAIGGARERSKSTHGRHAGAQRAYLAFFQSSSAAFHARSVSPTLIPSPPRRAPPLCGPALASFVVRI
jgi:hypothetical protein